MPALVRSETDEEVPALVPSESSGGEATAQSALSLSGSSGEEGARPGAMVLLVLSSAWMPRVASAEARREEPTCAEAGSEPDEESLVSQNRRRKRAARNRRKDARALAQADAARGLAEASTHRLSLAEAL